MLSDDVVVLEPQEILGATLDRLLGHPPPVVPELLGWRFQVGKVRMVRPCLARHFGLIVVAIVGDQHLSGQALANRKLDGTLKSFSPIACWDANKKPGYTILVVSADG